MGICSSTQYAADDDDDAILRSINKSEQYNVSHEHSNNASSIDQQIINKPPPNAVTNHQLNLHSNQNTVANNNNAAINNDPHKSRRSASTPDIHSIQRDQWIDTELQSYVNELFGFKQNNNKLSNKVSPQPNKSIQHTQSVIIQSPCDKQQHLLSSRDSMRKLAIWKSHTSKLHIYSVSARTGKLSSNDSMAAVQDTPHHISYNTEYTNRAAVNESNIETTPHNNNDDNNDHYQQCIDLPTIQHRSHSDRT